MRAGAVWRIGCTVVSIMVVQAVVCGLALLPIFLLWTQILLRLSANLTIRAIVFSVLLVPSYILFALCLLAVSSATTRVIGLRTPANTEMRISDMGWPLMTWAQHMVATHVVRVFAGTLFRGSPIWTAYLRLNGARIGRRVYINTVFISDHNLLDFADDVVIGADVHVSGHTVEAGVVKTGGVRLGRGVTIGLGSAVDIDVDIGAGCQVGALSFVPKHSTLQAGTVYAGIPVKRIA